METINKDQIWNETLESIKVAVSAAIYSTWFTQTHLYKIEDGVDRVTATVGCSSSFVKNTIESRYFGLIQDTLQKATGKPSDIVFIVKQNQGNKDKSLTAPLFSQNRTFSDSKRKISSQAGIRTTFTFENFAVSSSNQMAWAAAEAVSKSPGNAYNPLFIWGGVGVGKTHLMHAVGHNLLSHEDDAKIVVCTGEQFTNDIVEGIRNKTTQQVRSKYRKLTALFIDDIQFIAGKDAIQEEFFHTFNALVNAGAQVILTSDRPPSEISKLEERLRSRFEAGLIVDISEPDFELRCAITQIKAQEKHLEIEMPEVQIIAGNLDSARKIEGFLIRLVSETKLKNEEISAELIENLLGKSSEINGLGKSTDPRDVITAVADHYGIGKRALLGASRAQKNALPRQVLMYLMRVQIGLPLQEVGRLVGGRDHTTVMHAVDKITTLASSDVDIRADIRGIKNKL